MKIVISSGHGKYVRGASGVLDEVDEARRVVEETATWLRDGGHTVTTYHDDVSTTQNENLNRIVDFHNSQIRDLDVSVHFNCYEDTDGPMGTECLYLTQQNLANLVATTISDAGEFINRGAKYRDDLFFLNNTEMPSILIEVCFVDSTTDAALYDENFAQICEALGSMAIYTEPEKQEKFEGKVSWFGGPDDVDVTPDEGLAFLYEYEDAPHLFLDEQPPGTTGLARRLDPGTRYVACRWNYNITPKEMLASQGLLAMVRNKQTGNYVLAHPADWGPHEGTGRAADVSPAIMEELELDTDDEVEVTYPLFGGGHHHE